MVMKLCAWACQKLYLATIYIFILCYFNYFYIFMIYAAQRHWLRGVAIEIKYINKMSKQPYR